MYQKLKASVSDADILINFGKVDKLDIIELLFDEVIVPKKVFEELVRKDRFQYTKVYRRTYDTNSVFKAKDRSKDKLLNRLARVTISYYGDYIGPGEAECTGYAKALDIKIIISDNYTEFEEMEKEFIMLTHRDLLVLCLKHEKIQRSEAETIFTAINQNLQYPSRYNFDEWFDKSINRMYEKGWNGILGI